MSTSVFPRSQYDNGVPDITDPWPVKDIIYVGVMSPVMLLATLEWVLWILSLNYCFFRVFQKAESTGVKVLACLMSLLFTIIRLIFLPVMLVTLPLPAQVTKYFPPALVSALQWFAFWTFSTLLVIPWLICIYQLVTQSLGKTKRIMYVLDELTAPKVVIVMPCYNEPPDILVRTVDSLVDCDYPPSCLHIFLSFDGDEQNEMYLKTIEKLGVPLTLEDYPKSIDLVYRSTRITASRFPHGGKRMCQKRTFQLIDRVYTAYLKRNDNLFILFIDSDCILDKVCIQNFMYDMELKPGSKQNMLAMTGVITSTTEKNSLITILQDMEYIHGQLFERSVESGCGAVTCLPGALTILRFSAFRKMAKYYFADKFEQCEDMFDYAKCHLGEDRWLTHLFMIGAKERYQIQMNTGAFCKTEAVQDFKNLLKQRRRWFLGFITNEACMLTDTRLWRRYPLLLIIRFAQNTIRTTALLFFIMVISLATTSQKVVQLPIGFIAISLGLNWAIMIYFGAKLGRFKIWMYPLMFILNPFFNWLYMVYGIFTASQRTWGGPRADAGTADTQTTAQAAVERAEMMGDDLNVVPETFKPALAARRSLRGRTDITIPATHLQPSDKLHGRFAAATQTLEGHYVHDQGSTTTLPEVFVRNPNAPRMPLHPRNSFESELSATSGLYSFYMPRRVESIMDPEDTRYYHEQQRNQRPAGGAYFEENNYAAAYDNANQSTVRQPDPSTDSDDASTGTEMYLLKKPYAPVPHGHLSSSYQGEHRTAANASNSSISLFHPGSNITASGASGPSQGPMPRPVSGLAGKFPLPRLSRSSTVAAHKAAVPSPLAQMTRNSTPTELDEMLPRGSGSSEVRTVQGEAVGKESEGKRHRKKLSKPRPESK